MTTRQKTLQLAATIGVFIIFGALVVHAYTAPAVPVPGDNNEAVAINVSPVDQVKQGGLAVSAFLAGKKEGGALFYQQTAFKGVIRGGYPGDASSTVTVGSDLSVNGTIHAKSFLNAHSLENSSGKAPICATTDGTIILCP